MPSSPRLCFLGWNRAPLDAAGEWLEQRYGAEMSGVQVALPGGLAGRRLREKLARAIGPAWRPPEFRTAGGLVDGLLHVDGRLAGRLVRTLAWERALRDLDAARLTRITARTPDAEDRGGWSRLAEQVRTLFGEIAAEGIDFVELARRGPGSELRGEVERWSALAEAQERMVAHLAEAGLVDPHLGRLAAIEAGRVDDEAEVVLVGIVDMNGLLRRTLEQVGEGATALIPAPEEVAADFDELGCLRAESWAQRDVEWRAEQWRVVGKPEEQAAQVIRTMNGWEQRFAAEEITIGVAEAEVVPYLRQELAKAGITARDAAGIPLTRTAPARLLAAVARFVDRRRFTDYAALVRHPDLEARLRGHEELAGIESAALLDEYHADHLPDEIDGTWRGREKLRSRLERLHRTLLATLGELADPRRRGLPKWTEPIRALLLEVWGTRVLDPDAEEDRVLAAALRETNAALLELEEAPPRLAADATASEAIEIVLRMLRSRAVPPAAAKAGEKTIELLGWLELVLDDAPALVVTGFQDGRVPEVVHGDAFLPDQLRQSLHLVDNERRLARDVFATQLMINARTEVEFITGRRSAAGDPLLPSRIAFHRPAEEIAARVRHYLPAEDEGRPLAAAREDSATVTAAPLPRLAEITPPRSFSVTSFKTYLESPYLFYLQNVLRLESEDDRAREMDPLGFGNLAHDVLAAFGESAAKDSDDPAAIAKQLHAELKRKSRLRFGVDPLPAVALQVEQLARRFTLFAEHQAERAREGWRILHCEWAPAGAEDGLPFPTKRGEVHLRGRIDRIDHHPGRGHYAIWDYKTGEKVEGPEKTHRTKDKKWRDLQLPLYTLLASEVAEGELPELGYIALGKDATNIGFLPVKKWTVEDVEYAIEEAREIVEKVLAGELFDLARGKPYDEVFRAIVGQGLVAGSDDEEEEEA